MKKITSLFILLMIAGFSSYAQKKSGVVYSEHDAINSTRELWKAQENGDVAKYRSFFADTALVMMNDTETTPESNDQIGKGLSKWASGYDNLKIQDYKPAYPDAIEYKEGGTWVQDWLIMTGVHMETGIVLDLPVHNLYAFNEDGKVTMMLMYFNDDVFEEISNSKGTKENGTVYINHPYIVTVRKAVNAFVARDLDIMKSNYTPEAEFTFSSMNPGESMDLEEYMTYLEDRYFKDEISYKMEQVGYPDCVHYEQNDSYVVYSWWNILIKKDGKKHVLPLMISNDFNDEGKIVFTHIYASSNHFEFLN
jgi:hypothetical protein